MKHNDSKLFLLWDERYLTAIPVGLSAGSCHMSCQDCVYTKSQFHWVTAQPAAAAVASRSCSSHNPVELCVIVSGSITTLKCDNIICNNKSKSAWCHLCTMCTYGSAKGKRKHTHRNKSAQKNTCEHNVSLQFVSQTQAGLRFQALWSPKYISKYTSGSVSLLFTGKWFMGLFGE